MGKIQKKWFLESFLSHAAQRTQLLASPCISFRSLFPCRNVPVSPYSAHVPCTLFTLCRKTLCKICVYLILHPFLNSMFEFVVVFFLLTQSVENHPPNYLESHSLEGTISATSVSCTLSCLCVKSFRQIRIRTCSSL